MGFVPMALPDYVLVHLQNNRAQTAVEVTARLQQGLDKYNAGRHCSCSDTI